MPAYELVYMVKTSVSHVPYPWYLSFPIQTLNLINIASSPSLLRDQSPATLTGIPGPEALHIAYSTQIL